MFVDEATPLISHRVFPMDSNRLLSVDLLSAFFGLGSWISVNGMYTQLPLLVQTAPEGWSLPSYLSLLIQLANIGPVLYYFGKRFFGGVVKDSFIISAILFVGSLTMLYLAFSYSDISQVFGELHSTSLMIGAFLISIVGCSSSVLFFPFIGTFPEFYLVSFMVGEGLSGFIPSGLALVQGTGDVYCKNVTLPNGSSTSVLEMGTPRFSTKVFFLFIFFFMTLSSISFLLLNNLAVCRRERTKRTIRTKVNNIETVSNSISSTNSWRKTVLSPYSYGSMLVLQGVISFLSNGSLPSLQSYSCLPYGNEVYHLSIILVHITNPISCFIAFFLPHKSLKSVSALSALLAVFVSYVITLAALSPNPPLQDEPIGKVLVIFGWVACAGLMSYIKLSIAALFNDAGGAGLFWYGASTQLGAFLGAGFMFVLINVFQLFQSHNVCGSS